MIVNGKEIKLNHSAQTYASQAFTNKFWNMDRILFNMSPFLTFEESDKIMDEMEKRATSQYEGNWTTSDCLMFLRETLGNDRWNAVEMMWEMGNQTAITQYNNPGDLRDAYIHKITMTEGTAYDVEKNPDDYILIQTTK
jgi:hypothetical protein